MLPNLLVFDIETAPYPTDQILQEAEPFDPESVKVGNIKDPEKIANTRLNAAAKYQQALVDEAALHATTGRVLVVGIHDVREDGYMMLEGNESDILRNFWLSLETVDMNARLVGFNILAFDLPFLVRRSWLHEILVPYWVFDGRYFSRRFHDLMVFWQLGNRQDSISLDKFAKFILGEGKSHSGKDFSLRYADNREEALAYVRQDLALTAKLALRLQV